MVTVMVVLRTAVVEHGGGGVVGYMKVIVDMDSIILVVVVK